MQTNNILELINNIKKHTVNIETYVTLEIILLLICGSIITVYMIDLIKDIDRKISVSKLEKKTRKKKTNHTRSKRHTDKLIVIPGSPSDKWRLSNYTLRLHILNSDYINIIPEQRETIKFDPYMYNNNKMEEIRFEPCIYNDNKTRESDRIDLGICNNKIENSDRIDLCMCNNKLGETIA